MVSRVIPVDLFDLVIFGGTGDLARRKILPGLYRRFLDGQIPEESRIIAAARSEMDDAGYRDMIREAIVEFVGKDKQDKTCIEKFLSRLAYVQVDATGTDGWDELAEKMRDGVVRAFYFSVGPSLFGAIAERLHAYHIADEDSRIVVEKPFGHDLATARALNQTLAEHFDESQIYRIDHYLGQRDRAKPDGRCALATCCLSRFGMRAYVDHIQITVAETVGVEGRGRIL